MEGGEDSAAAAAAAVIIKTLQILRSIARGHDHVPILFSPYIAVRFAAAVVAVAARRRYRAP